MTIDRFESTDPDPPRPACICRRCGRALTPGRGELYVVSVIAVADPYPPVFTAADLALDAGAEIRRLIKQLSGIDALQAHDQVYRRLVFHLCAVLRAMDRRTHGVRLIVASVGRAGPGLQECRCNFAPTLSNPPEFAVAAS